MCASFYIQTAWYKTSGLWLCILTQLYRRAGALILRNCRYSQGGDFCTWTNRHVKVPLQAQAQSEDIYIVMVLEFWVLSTRNRIQTFPVSSSGIPSCQSAGIWWCEMELKQLQHPSIQTSNFAIFLHFLLRLVGKLIVYNMSWQTLKFSSWGFFVLRDHCCAGLSGARFWEKDLKETKVLHSRKKRFLLIMPLFREQYCKASVVKIYSLKSSKLCVFLFSFLFSICQR